MKKLLFCMLVLSMLCCSCVPEETVIGEGCVEKVEFIAGGWGQDARTILRFEDGSITVLRGHRSLPSKCVRVWCHSESGKEYYRIVSLEMKGDGE